MAETCAAKYALLPCDGSFISKSTVYAFQSFIQLEFDNFISSMNEKVGVRKKKHIGALIETLQNRGILCHSLPDSKNEAVLIKQNNCCVTVERQIGKGLFLTLENINFKGTDVSYGAACTKKHVSASEEDIADLLEMFDHFLDLCNNVIASEEDKLRHQNLLSEIEMPVIEIKVGEYMQKKGINKYNLYIDNQGKIALEVQIIDIYWMRNNTINLENLERVLGIIPYLIKRPDRIKEDGLGFESFKKW